MKYFLNPLVIVVALISVFAPVAKAQDFYYPDVAPMAPLELTKAQKGVALSTDVAAVLLPVTAMVSTCVLKDWEGLKQGAFTAAAAVGSMLILKYSVRELRPDRSNYHSFPSGHSTIAFASAAYIQRRYGWKVGIPAYALATYTAVGRVVSKKHHWWDVVAGAAIGTASAYIFTRPWAVKHDLAISPYADDISVGLAASFSF